MTAINCLLIVSEETLNVQCITFYSTFFKSLIFFPFVLVLGFFGQKFNFVLFLSFNFRTWDYNQVQSRKKIYKIVSEKQKLWKNLKLKVPTKLNVWPIQMWTQLVYTLIFQKINLKVLILILLGWNFRNALQQMRVGQNVEWHFVKNSKKLLYCKYSENDP